MKRLLQTIDPGLSTTIQDAGRQGLRRFGIPRSGAADFQAMCMANFLAGNPAGHPVLECTLKGGRYLFLQDSIAGIAGAEISVKIGNETVAMNRTLLIPQGAVLYLDYARKGCRAYLAVAGKLLADEVFGSCATFTAAVFGGFQGRALKKGDLLEWTGPGTLTEERTIPEDLLHRFSEETIIRVVQGPEWELLDKESRQLFQELPFDVLPQSNRMGMRLQGSPLKTDRPISMTSSATLTGTIQLLPSGQLVVLLHDGQTTGGYPRIGKVIEADLGRLAQVPPGKKMRFRETDSAEAQALYRHQRKRLEALFDSC